MVDFPAPLLSSDDPVNCALGERSRLMVLVGRERVRNFLSFRLEFNGNGRSWSPRFFSDSAITRLVATFEPERRTSIPTCQCSSILEAGVSGFAENTIQFSGNAYLDSS